MNPTIEKKAMEKQPIAIIASLHLHPKKGGGPIKGGAMTSVTEMELVEGKGIKGNDRYFDRKTSKGEPSPRQVSLIDRSMIAYHEQQVDDIGCLPAGAIRSNIETTLPSSENKTTNEEIPECPYVSLLNKQLRIGTTAVIELTFSRTPCWEMDVLSKGLQNSMRGDMQGVLAKVIKSGTIKVGDPIFVVDSSPQAEK